MQRISPTNGEAACQIQIAQLWNDLLVLQSQVHHHSLKHESPWAANSSLAESSIEQCEVPIPKNRRYRPNRKGLKERLRHKRRAPTLWNQTASGCEGSSSEGHKVWQSTDESEHADTMQDLRKAKPYDFTMLASMQEKLFAKSEQLQTREVGLVERELQVQIGELEEKLHNETLRADQAEALQHEEESLKQAALEKNLFLKADLEAQVVRANDDAQKVQELQAKLFKAEFESGALSVNNKELEEKLRQAQIESGTLTARNTKLATKLRDSEIESGTLTARIDKIEAKLREAEIDSGTLTARNLQLQEMVWAVHAPVIGIESRTGGATNRATVA
jgi:hypothetical protein